jgi:hypothetical protein
LKTIGDRLALDNVLREGDCRRAPGPACIGKTARDAEDEHLERIAARGCQRNGFEEGFESLLIHRAPPSNSDGRFGWIDV